MRFAIYAALAGAASAASQWSFSDAKIEVIPKTASADGTTVSHVFTDKELLKDTVTLGHADKIKVSLTTKEGSKAKRPHQAFLMVKEKGGLEAPYALTVKESGKGTVEFVCSSRTAAARKGLTNYRARRIFPSSFFHRPSPSRPA